MSMEQMDILDNILDQHDVVTLDDVRNNFGLSNDKARILFEDYLSTLSSRMSSLEVQYAISGYTRTEGDHDELPIHRFMIVDQSELNDEEHFNRITSKYLFQIAKNKANRKHCEDIKEAFDRLCCFLGTPKAAEASIKIKNPICKMREKEPLLRVDLDGKVCSEALPLVVDVSNFEQTTNDAKRKLDNDFIVTDGQPPTKKTATDQNVGQSQTPQSSTQELTTSQSEASQTQPSQPVTTPQDIKPKTNPPAKNTKPAQKKQASIMTFFKKA